MTVLSCFVIIPSNNGKGLPIPIVRDDKWGLMQLPTECEPKTPDTIDFDEVYKYIIQEAVDRVNRKDRSVRVESTRAQDLRQAGSILQQVIERVCTADITITDITTQNPNVFFEYGIRLAVRDSLNIMICHKDAELPFDVNHLRVVRYSMDHRDAEEAISKIVAILENYVKPAEGSEPRDERESLYRRYVDLYTGRKLDRDLAKLFDDSAKLVIALTTVFFAGEKPPHLKRDLFEFFDKTADLLKDDPAGHDRVVQFLTLVSQVKGLSRERLQSTFYRLADIYSAAGVSQEAEANLEKAIELEV